MKSQARQIAVLFFCIAAVTAGAISGAATRTPDNSAPAQQKGTSTKKSGSAMVTQHMKLDQFFALSPDQQAAYLGGYIQKVMDTLASVNPQLPQAVHDYFYKEQPDGTSGLTIFSGVALDLRQRASQGQVDLSKQEVDSMILALVKRDVLPQFTKNNPQSPTAAHH